MVSEGKQSRMTTIVAHVRDPQQSHNAWGTAVDGAAEMEEERRHFGQIPAPFLAGKKCTSRRTASCFLRLFKRHSSRKIQRSFHLKRVVQ